MTILLCSFFISLTGLGIMLGRKLAELREIEETPEENTEIAIPYIAEAREIAVRKIKRYGYVGLVTTIRLYFRSSRLMKAKYEDLKVKAKNLQKNDLGLGMPGKEVNKFLKVVSDYKHKIRKIKHKIKEEENLV